MITRNVERAVSAAATLIIPAALRILPLSAVLALCDRWPRLATHDLAPAQLANRVRRWLARGRGPWESTCLTRSLVLYALLRQHGYRPQFFVGVAGSAQRFDAHAWVTIDDKPVADPPDVSGTYAQLLSHCA